jgi:hypothetical protein
VPFGVKPGGQQCDTPIGLCSSETLATYADIDAPCCRTCPDFGGGRNWFWQCALPRSTAGVYTFEMVAGQFYFMGTCKVTVDAASVTIGDCEIAAGWTATVAHFYLGETPSGTCAPGQFGYQESFPATTGPLPTTVSRSVLRTQSAGTMPPIFVMLRMETQR